MNSLLKKTFAVFCALSVVPLQSAHPFAVEDRKNVSALSRRDQALECSLLFAKRSLLLKYRPHFASRPSSQLLPAVSSRSYATSANKFGLIFPKLLMMLPLALSPCWLPLFAQDILTVPELPEELPKAHIYPDNLPNNLPNQDSGTKNSRFILDAKALSRSPTPTETILNLVVWAKQYELSRDAVESSQFHARIAGSISLGTVDNVGMSPMDADVVSRLYAKLYYSQRGVEELLYVLKTEFGLSSKEIKKIVNERVQLEHHREDVAHIPKGRRFSLSDAWSSLKPIHHPDAFGSLDEGKTNMRRERAPVENRKKSIVPSTNKLIGSAA